MRSEAAQQIKPSTYGWHEVPGEGKTLREKWIDSGSESGMTKNCHAELVSASSRRGRILSNLIGGQTLNQVQGDKILKNLFTYSRTNLLTSKKVAFTLAEVLITLAIIGVVAAMTIPTLVSNYKKQVVETRLAKFYSTMTQAIKLSEIDNGKLSTWNNLTAEKIYNDEGVNIYAKSENPLDWFNKYLANYIRVVKIEEEMTMEGNLGIYFNDGSLLLISANSWLFYPYAEDFKTIYMEKYDITNRVIADSGKKYFTFIFTPKDGLIPYTSGWDGTKEMLLENTSIGCNENVTNERAYCTKLIQLNNWKIPKDYPFKF